MVHFQVTVVQQESGDGAGPTARRGVVTDLGAKRFPLMP